MDLGKMRDAVASMPRETMEKMINAFKEINTLKEMCRAKGFIEIEKRSLRIKVLKKNKLTKELLAVIKKSGIEGVLVEDDKNEHTKTKKPIRR